MSDKQLNTHTPGVIKKSRSGIALLVVLPLIVGMFWLMYYWAIGHSIPQKTSQALQKQQVQPVQQKVMPKDQPAPERIVAVETPTEMKSKTQPDITVVLGLKKPVPKKREEPVILVREDEPEAARKGRFWRQETKQESPDPYPDAK